MVTSSDPRSPIAEIVASISALRRRGSIPIFGILGVRFGPRLFFIDASINKKSTPGSTDRVVLAHGVGLENGSSLNNIESRAAKDRARLRRKWRLP
jgi:hypothetical protein